jgi:hypothetical protein
LNSSSGGWDTLWVVIDSVCLVAGPDQLTGPLTAATAQVDNQSLRHKALLNDPEEVGSRLQGNLAEAGVVIPGGTITVSEWSAVPRLRRCAYAVLRVNQ